LLILSLPVRDDNAFEMAFRDGRNIKLSYRPLSIAAAICATIAINQ
jgi:hypothetical protein